MNKISGDNASYNIKASAHPGLLIIGIVFKSIPIVVYFLISSLALNIGLITLISSIDFWYVKNIFGRVCAGLKWGRLIEDNGKEKFFFECKKDEKTVNQMDKKFFWTIIVLGPVIWSLLLFFNILSFKNLLIILLPFVLNWFNLWAFYKCSSEQQERLKGLIREGKEGGINTIVNNYNN